MNVLSFRFSTLARLLLVCSLLTVFSCEDDDTDDGINSPSNQTAPSISFKTVVGYASGAVNALEGDNFLVGVTASGSNGKNIVSITVTENGSQIASQTFDAETAELDINITAGAFGTYEYVFTVTDDNQITNSVTFTLNSLFISPDGPTIAFVSGGGFIGSDATVFPNTIYGIGVDVFATENKVIESYELTENGNAIFTQSDIDETSYIHDEILTAGTPGTYVYVGTATDDRGDSNSATVTVTVVESPVNVFTRVWAVENAFIDGIVAPGDFSEMLLEFTSTADGLPDTYTLTPGAAPYLPTLGEAPDTGDWTFDDVFDPAAIIFDPAGTAVTASIVGTPTETSLSLLVLLDNEDPNKPDTEFRFDFVPAE